MGSSIKCVTQCAEDPYRDESSESQPDASNRKYFSKQKQFLVEIL